MGEVWDLKCRRRVEAQQYRDDVRRIIDEERYQPALLFPTVLTGIASLIGLLLAVYLTFTT